MKTTSWLALIMSTCGSLAHAQTNAISPDVYTLSVITPASKKAIAVDVEDLQEPGTPETATKVFGYPGKRMGLSTVGEPRRFTLASVERDSSSRAWGKSIGIQGGPITFRFAHQNRGVKVDPLTPLGIRTDAKNSVAAANIDIGPVKAYAAYSATRGWGSSPLWNPDNPYGAAMAATPSTDSRDVLVGMALPMGPTTLLASFVRKNDRDLANLDAQQLAFGATYTMSRRLDFYAALSHTQLRAGAASAMPVYSRGSTALNLGMRHSF